MAGCILIHVCFDAFVEFTGPKPFRQNISSSLNCRERTLIHKLYLCSHYTQTHLAFEFCFLQHNHHCNHCNCNLCVKLVKILCCLHVWYGLKGVTGWVRLCSDDVLRMHRALHTHQTFPSRFLQYFIATVMPSPQIYR